MKTDNLQRSSCEGLAIHGRVEVFVHDAETGALVDYRADDNIVTDVGFQLICDILAQTTTDQLLYVAAGTGTTTPAAGDTTLQTEVWRSAIVTKTRSGATLVVQAYMGTGEGNGYSLTEFGILTAASAGRLFNHVLLSPAVAKDASKTLTIQITISLSR